ncbi:acetamidase [Colletotrichum scovillei]|nr:acetamidase [Colletotrichum scovillei]
MGENQDQSFTSDRGCSTELPMIESGITTRTPTPPWKLRAAQKRAEQYAKIPVGWRIDQTVPPPKDTDTFLRSSGVLSAEELACTEVEDIQVLLEQIATRKLSAVQVLKAFAKRAAIAQQLVKCCTELMFEEALERAKALDEHLERTGSVVGPLHGLPVSLKDIFNVKGFDSTIGWVNLIGKPAKENSVLSDVLIAQGAVPFVKTNVAQALMLSDSYNHVFKQSLNSLNRKLISGGSSGGEAALVGCHGSLVGIGTDTGGSIRIPAALQGLYGLKPTVGRLPFEESSKWEFIAPPVAGPLAFSLSTIETFMDGILSCEPWRKDPTLLPIPWRKELTAKPDKPLKIGYYINDNVVRVQPPIERAVRAVVDSLTAVGHTLIEWDPTSHAEAYKDWTTATFADGGESHRMLSEASGEPLVKGLLVGTEEDILSVAESRHLAAKKLKYEQEYLKRWNEAGIDALITPVAPWVGMRPRVWAKSKPHVGYTSHWNWLDYAALTIPVMRAENDGASSQQWTDHVPWNESDEMNYQLYDFEQIRGMPVGVQIIGGSRCVLAKENTMNSSPASPRRRHILSSVNPGEGHEKTPEPTKRKSSPGPTDAGSEAQAQAEPDDGENLRPRSSRIRLKSKHSKSSRSHRHRSHDPDAADNKGNRSEHRHSRRHHHSSSRQHRRRSRSPTPPNPYEPQALDPDAAFRESLFDAMADDEGAAYWQGVYGQPIHVYSNERPGPEGELERMTDEEYSQHVRQKMWEKTHQGLLEERARREEARKRKKEEEKVNRKLQEDMERSLRRGEERRKKRAWVQLWEDYTRGWTEWANNVDKIPWPVESGRRRDVNENEVRRFIVNGLGLEDIGEKEFAAKLREERVRWHPDKMQQKLGGQVDDEVMKDITAIFQIIDKLWADTRSKA